MLEHRLVVTQTLFLYLDAVGHGVKWFVHSDNLAHADATKVNAEGLNNMAAWCFNSSVKCNNRSFTLWFHTIEQQLHSQAFILQTHISPVRVSTSRQSCSTYHCTLHTYQSPFDNWNEKDALQRLITMNKFSCASFSMHQLLVRFQQSHSVDTGRVESADPVQTFQKCNGLV